MGKKSLFFFATIVLMIFINGCTSERQIEGEIFIVTKGRENVKLGLVDVKAIPEEKALAFVEKTITMAKEEAEKIRTQCDQLQAELDNAKIKHKDYYTQNPDYSSEEKFPILLRLTKNMEDVQERYDHCISSKMYNHWKEDLLFNNLPETKITSKTNAEGKFIMTLTKNKKYALVASASRQLYNETEKYYWMVWFIPKGKTNKVILSNDNLLEVDCSDCVFKLMDL